MEPSDWIVKILKAANEAGPTSVAVLALIFGILVVVAFLLK